MNITLYVRSGCEICESTQNQLDHLLQDEKKINYEIINLSLHDSSNVQIVPALFVEDELYSYGELNEIRFKKMLNSHSV
ncbi:glutaredoxin family protein [Bacteroidota bacterium]